MPAMRVRACMRAFRFTTIITGTDAATRRALAVDSIYISAALARGGYDAEALN